LPLVKPCFWPFEESPGQPPSRLPPAEGDFAGIYPQAGKKCKKNKKKCRPLDKTVKSWYRLGYAPLGWLRGFPAGLPQEVWRAKLKRFNFT